MDDLKLHHVDSSCETSGAGSSQSGDCENYNLKNEIDDNSVSKANNGEFVSTDIDELDLIDNLNYLTFQQAPIAFIDEYEEFNDDFSCYNEANVIATSATSGRICKSDVLNNATGQHLNPANLPSTNTSKHNSINGSNSNSSLTGRIEYNSNKNGTNSNRIVNEGDIGATVAENSNATIIMEILSESEKLKQVLNDDIVLKNQIKDENSQNLNSNNSCSCNKIMSENKITSEDVIFIDECTNESVGVWIERDNNSANILTSTFVSTNNDTRLSVALNKNKPKSKLGGKNVLKNNLVESDTFLTSINGEKFQQSVENIVSANVNVDVFIEKDAKNVVKADQVVDNKSALERIQPILNIMNRIDPESSMNNLDSLMILTKNAENVAGSNILDLESKERIDSNSNILEQHLKKETSVAPVKITDSNSNGLEQESKNGESQMDRDETVKKVEPNSNILEQHLKIETSVVPVERTDSNSNALEQELKNGELQMDQDETLQKVEPNSNIAGLNADPNIASNLGLDSANVASVVTRVTATDSLSGAVDGAKRRLTSIGARVPPPPAIENPHLHAGSSHSPAARRHSSPGSLFATGQTASGIIGENLDENIIAKDELANGKRYNCIDGLSFKNGACENVEFIDNFVNFNSFSDNFYSYIVNKCGKADGFPCKLGNGVLVCDNGDKLRASCDETVKENVRITDFILKTPLEFKTTLGDLKTPASPINNQHVETNLGDANAKPRADKINEVVEDISDISDKCVAGESEKCENNDFPVSPVRVGGKRIKNADGVLAESKSVVCGSSSRLSHQSCGRENENKTSKDLTKFIDSSVRDTLRHVEGPPEGEHLKSNFIHFEGSSRLKRLEERFKDLNSKKISPSSGDKEPDIQLIPPYLLRRDDDEVCKKCKKQSSQTININLRARRSEDRHELISDFYTNCEFDAREIGNYALPLGNTSYFECYDELEDDEATSSTCNFEDDEILDREVLLAGDICCEMREAHAKMVHNKDHSNLKSLLKKQPSSGRTSAVRKNRVIFNENKNEFFDADYIILIREDCSDCPYDEEEEEGVCTCNDHEMVRVQPYPPCCEEHCKCAGYEDECTQTPQSPKFPPPLEFVDQATLSPPEGYKDGGLGGALGALGAQHLQQLQVIQRLQAQRNQMIAANRERDKDRDRAVCADCSHHDSDSETRCSSEECSAVPSTVGAPGQEHPQGQATHLGSSPERRGTLKEIIAGEERPMTAPIHQDDPQSQRYIVETITMTTVTERRIVREAEDKGGDFEKGAEPTGRDYPGPDAPALSGILKGGRLWKTTDLPPQEDTTSFCSDDDSSSRRSVRFCEGSELQELSNEELAKITSEESETCDKGISTDGTNELTMSFKLSNSNLYANSLRPNSAVRQLFPANKGSEDQQKFLVTADNLRAFEEAKRATTILSNKETDEDASIRRTIERNALRRSLIKYEPKRKTQKTDNSLEERIRQLTCMDDAQEEEMKNEDRNSSAGEETQEVYVQRTQYLPEKSFSPCSSSSNSSSSSTSSTYKKITDLFSRRQERHERILEAPENNEDQNIVIIPQENPQTNCKCPTAPDLGNGVNSIPTQQQIQQHGRATTPPSTHATTNEARKQFLASLAPLAACVSANHHPGMHEDYYYPISRTHPLAGDRTRVASSTQCSEYSLGDIDDVLKGDRVVEPEPVAPDVIAGTPGTPGPQETDELAVFVQQDANRIERIKKRYSADPLHSPSDDEHDDYGFNRRPSVRGIKPRFGSTTEIIQQMQTQLQTPSVGLDKNQWFYSSNANATDGAVVANNRNSYHEENLYQNVYEGHLYHGNHLHRSQNDMQGRSPIRGRPESPPPLRNYHQTMVLIPYNNADGGYAHHPPHYSSSEPVHEHPPPQANDRYRRSYPMMEYHHQHQQSVIQVGGQMIRVPVPVGHVGQSGYVSPNVQLHLVAGRGVRPPGAGQYNHRYQQRPYSESPPNRQHHQYIENVYETKYHTGMCPPGVKFAERGAPEGAASAGAQDSYVTSPTGGPQNIQQGGQPVNAPAPVYYAMNV